MDSQPNIELSPLSSLGKDTKLGVRLRKTRVYERTQSIPEYIRKAIKTYYIKHKEQIALQRKEYYLKNSEKLKQKMKENYQKRKAEKTEVVNL